MPLFLPLRLRARRLAAPLTAFFLAVGVPATARTAPKAVRTAPVPANAAAARPVAAKTTYYGVYLSDAKVGTLIVRQSPEKRGAMPVLRTDGMFTMDMKMLGAPAKAVTSTTSWTDKSGKLVAMNYKSEAMGRATRVTATFTPNSVTYEADIMGTQDKGTLTLKPGETFLIDVDSGAADIKPTPGLKRSGKIFSPETRTLLDSEFTVVGQEPVAIGGQSVPAYRVISKNTIATSTVWLNASGDMLRYDTVMGIQMRREPKELALAAPKPGQKIDLAMAVGIKPTGEEIKDPRDLERAEYEITGLTKKLPLKDNSVQKAAHEPDPQAGPDALRARVTVQASPLPTGPTVPLFTPQNRVAAPLPLRPYLKATAYVPADDPAFRELARKIVGGEMDAAKAAGRIARWVHKTVKPDPSIAIVRTAGDILRDPRGVCRDYTTLFTAIARAAGLPTKQCVGIAYASGAFLYHAWPEVWVGGDTWVALEPTWGAPYADATHIKLAEGEITDVVNLANDMGRYQVKVLKTE